LNCDINKHQKTDLYLAAVIRADWCWKLLEEHIQQVLCCWAYHYFGPW